ncbi:hypothetical protein T4D_7925 [Trichinella pseudospiralis]|uniref:Uncharacterized protein n=1 Tax=Trichinella pseudospiralis TaxID=6337 RepID=A0A0V1FY83_TRIPS|nr:hypothetical protein T4D_7925 [Trichinella pseudospiralis]
MQKERKTVKLVLQPEIFTICRFVRFYNKIKAVTTLSYNLERLCVNSKIFIPWLESYTKILKDYQRNFVTVNLISSQFQSAEGLPYLKHCFFIIFRVECMEDFFLFVDSGYLARH